MTRALIVAAGAAVLLLSPAGLWAHGGSYRGPGGSAPPPGGSSGSSSGGSSPSAPGSGSGSGGGAAAPGPAAPSGGPAPSGAPVGAATSRGRGVQVGEDLTRWQYWWEWNKDPYLRLKEAVHATAVVRGSDDDLMAGRRRSLARDTLRPTEAEVVEQVLPALKRALDQTDQRDIVSGCLVAMAKIGRDHPEFAILPLMRQRLRSHDQEIRETAALAMGIAGMPVAAPDLIALVRDDATGRQLCDRSAVDERTRSFAAYGLGLLGRKATVGTQRVILEALVERVRAADTGRDLRVAAINAIRVMAPDSEAGRAARILRDQAVVVLWDYYRGEQHPGQQVVRAHALPAIAQLVGRDGDADGRHRDALAAELEAPKLRDAAVTQAAAMALGMLCRPEEVREADRRYVHVLRKAFGDSPDHQTRFFCLMALGNIGGDANRQWLLDTLSRGSKALVKPWAGFALGLLAFDLRDVAGSEAVRAEIGRALHREFREMRNDETRAALAVALGLCGHRAAADDLRALLREEQHRDELAGYLCIGLAQMGAREAIGEIRQIVTSSVRRPLRLRQASIALGKLGDKDASELLLGLLVDDNRNLAKLSAISVALGLIGDRRSIAPLTRLLLNESEPAISRAFAAVALGGVADPRVLPWGADLAVGVNYRAAVGTLTDGIAGVLDIL